MLEEAERLENSLIDFFEGAWPEFDPAPYAHNWHFDALAEHLQAVAFGEIRNLLINMPPRHGKTLLSGVAFNAWVWAHRHDPAFPLLGPQVKFMCLSYGYDLSLEAATHVQRLIRSEWYQSRWGNRFQLAADQSSKEKFDNTAGGTRISGSFGGSVLGRGADIRIIDDPHKVKEVESEVVREGVIREYDETLRARVTDPRSSATIITMHRVHADDLAAHVLETDDFVHLCLPEEYESTRLCHTVIGWEDPRQEDGELLWPERFTPEVLAPFKRNPYLWAGQWQQLPEPRGGGIIKSDWWLLWEDTKHWPVFDFIVASFDGAYTTDDENDPCAMTVWGVFTHYTPMVVPNQVPAMARGPMPPQRTSYGRKKVFLLDAWREHLEFHDCVSRIHKTCKDKKVDLVLIEGKANGISIEQEMRRLFSHEPWGIERIQPDRDKAARLTSTVSLFTDGAVYAPNTDWAQMVIDEVGAFRGVGGSRDDLTDTTSQALNYLRRAGLLELAQEAAMRYVDRMKYERVRASQLPYVS